MAGQKVTFKAEGNEMPGVPSSDLVFLIKEKPHQCYKREGNDLIYKMEISLVNALCAEPIELLTLDQRRLRVSMTEIISNETVQKVENEGMPILGGSGKGNLYLTFRVIFPTTLNENQRVQLKEVLC